jgi:hypothetical protein
MTLPRKIEKPPRFNAPKRIKSHAHLNWIREHGCCVPGCKNIDIQAAHVRSGTNGGASLKPGDDWAISLCGFHHIEEQHRIGERAFELKHGIDMKALAREFAAKSPKIKRNHK